MVRSSVLPYIFRHVYTCDIVLFYCHLSVYPFKTFTCHFTCKNDISNVNGTWNLITGKGGPRRRIYDALNIAFSSVCARVNYQDECVFLTSIFISISLLGTPLPPWATVGQQPFDAMSFGVACVREAFLRGLQCRPSTFLAKGIVPNVCVLLAWKFISKHVVYRLTEFLKLKFKSFNLIAYVHQTLSILVWTVKQNHRFSWFYLLGRRLCSSV